MIDITKSWLEAVPWETVKTINQALCQAKQTEFATNAKSCLTVANRWEQGAGKRMGLLETLDLIRECREALPFTFNNGNTFAAVAKTLVDEWLKALPPLEAQVMRTTVCHYVAGQVGRRELQQVLEHLGPACLKVVPSGLAPNSQPVGRVQEQGAS